MTVPPPEGPAIVTVREVYDLVLQVKERIDRQNVHDLAKDVEDHETRIRGLEKWVWRASGIAALVGAGLSQALDRLGTFAP